MDSSEERRSFDQLQEAILAARERARLRNRILWLLNLAVIIFTAATALITFIIVQSSSSTRQRTFLLTSYQRQSKDVALQDIDRQIASMEARLDAQSKPSPEMAGNKAFADLSSAVRDIGEREQALEKVIMDNPSKALQMPLFQKQLDSLKEDQTSSVAAMKDNVDRIYDLNKWLLGSLSVGMITLAATNLLKTRDKPPTTEG